MKEGYVYILSNAQRSVFYTGVSNDLINRLYKHKQGIGAIFTSKYNVHFLMYFEIHQTMYEAI